MNMTCFLVIVTALLSWLATPTAHATATVLNVPNSLDIIDGNINSIYGSAEIVNSNLTYILCSSSIQDLPAVIYSIIINNNITLSCPCGTIIVDYPSDECTAGYISLTSNTTQPLVEITFLAQVGAVLCQLTLNATQAFITAPIPPSYQALQAIHAEIIANNTPSRPPTTQAPTTQAPTTPTPTQPPTIIILSQNITIVNFAFSPTTVTIEVGETVQWIWLQGFHGIVSGNVPNSDGQFCSLPIGSTINNNTCSSTNTAFSAPHTYTQTFNETGDYPYFCWIHTYAMTGLIHVVNSTNITTTTTSPPTTTIAPTTVAPTTLAPTTQAPTTTAPTTTAPTTLAPTTTAPTTNAPTTTAPVIIGVNITIVNFAFSPSSATVVVGQSVQWIWVQGFHGVVSGNVPTSDGKFCSLPSGSTVNSSTCSSNNVAFNAPHTFIQTFTQVGDYPYFCWIHTTAMTGVIHVTN